MIGSLIVSGAPAVDLKLEAALDTDDASGFDQFGHGVFRIARTEVGELGQLFEAESGILVEGAEHANLRDREPLGETVLFERVVHVMQRLKQQPERRTVLSDIALLAYDGLPLARHFRMVFGDAITTLREQQSRARELRKALHAPDDDHMVAAIVLRFGAAFEVRDHTLEQRHAIGPRPPLRPCKPVGVGGREKVAIRRSGWQRGRSPRNAWHRETRGSCARSG